MEDRKDEIITPHKMIVAFDVVDALDNAKTNNTVIADPKNAKRVVVLRLRKMREVAGNKKLMVEPNAAPEEAPNKNGSAMGFLKRL